MTNDSDASLTIDEFCRLEHLSRFSFFRLRQRGLAPKVLCIPGTRILRITPEARHRWHAEMATLAEQDAAQLEQERRREQASRAGRIAARSPRHVCRRARNGAAEIKP